MADYPIALASYSFHGLRARGMMDVFGYLEAARYRYGVLWADIWSGFLPTYDDDFILKVREALDEKDMRLANLCVDGPFVWQGDVEKSDAAKKTMLSALRAAKTLGAKTVRIDFGGSDAPMPEEAFDYIVKTYREYCEICADAGMKIGPENHWGWDKKPEYLAKVKEAVNHPAYGHLYHFLGFNEGLEEGHKLAISYAMHTHIPASTMPRAKEIIRELAQSGYEGAYSIEHHSGEHELARVGWQLGTVRACVAELKTEGMSEAAVKDYMAKQYE